jgi:hypothetical protein
LRVSFLADSAVKDTRKRPAAGMPQLLLEANPAIAGSVHGRGRHRLIAQASPDHDMQAEICALPVPRAGSAPPAAMANPLTRELIHCSFENSAKKYSPVTAASMLAYLPIGHR